MRFFVKLLINFSVFILFYSMSLSGSADDARTLQSRIALVPAVSAAPLPPGNVHSVQGDGYVRTIWAKNTDPNVSGFAIYRSTDGGASYAKIGTVSEQAANFFDDTAVQNGLTYFYRVKAADPSGAEGEFSIPTATTYHYVQVSDYTPGPAGVAAVGDLNGDGKPDLVLGVPYSSLYEGRVNGKILKADRVYIYLGGKRRVSPNVTLVGENDHDSFGAALAVVDINNDGYDDLIVGAPGYGLSGKVYVYKGGPRFGATPAFTMTGKGGGAIASVGDVNGDGYRDIAIGGLGGGVNGGGGVLVLLGGSTMVERTLSIYGPGDNEGMGFAVAAAGDVNGDGFADIIASTSIISGVKGKAYLVYGGGELRLADFSFPGGTSYYGTSFYSSSSASAGLDFNGDGFSDVVVNMNQIGNMYSGGLQIDNSPEFSFAQDFPTRPFSLGDIDKDGYEDLLAGKVYLGTSAADNIPVINASYGGAIGVGDLDNDGLKEIIGMGGLNITVGSFPSLRGLPQISLSTPSRNDVTSLTPGMTISGTVKGDATSLLVAGEEIQVLPDGTFQTTVNIQDGVNVIELIARAPDGRIAKRTVRATYNVPPLAVAVTAPVHGSDVKVNTVTVTGTVSDPTAVVKVNNVPVTLSGQTFQTTVKVFNGCNLITAVASNARNQTATGSVTVNLLLNGLIGGYVTDASTGAPLPGVTVAVTDSVTTRGTTTTASGYYSVSTAPGDYTLTFTRDGYARQTLTGAIEPDGSRTVNVQLSPAPPLSLAITAPLDGATFATAPINVSGTVTNNAQVTVNGVPATVANGSFFVSIPLNEGLNTITATAMDQYGQSRSAGVNVTLKTVWRISVNPASLDFGALTTGASKSLSLTVSNISATNLSLGTVTRPSAPFWAVADACSGKTLLPSASCAVTVQFSPTTEGTFNGALSIPSDDEYHPNVMVSLSGTASAYEGYRLPDTGQTLCFDRYGNVSSACTGIPYLGQDGYYTINPLQYAVNGSFTVTDENTRLVWEREGSATAKTWTEAASYCQNLNLDGYTGWRLPTFLELMTIVHYGQSNPAIDIQAFPNTHADNYWTSTTETVDIGGTWVEGAKAVNFAYGEAGPITKTSSAYVRCVRGAQLAQKGFVVNGDNTFTDLDSGLMWTQDTFQMGDWYGFASASGLFSYAGYSDWRLPNIKELATYPNPVCIFGDCLAWSSTTLNRPDAAGLYLQAYASDTTSIVPDNKGSIHASRYVRGGNRGPKDAWEISVTPPALDFGYQETGKQTTIVVMVANTGTGNLVVGTIPAPAGPFSILSDGCSGQTIPASASCAVSVQFSTLSAGTFSSAFTIPSNDADNPSVTVNMVGTASPPETALSGTVTDASTGLPVAAVAVTVTDSLNVTQTVSTDVNGAYVVASMATGGFSGTITKNGYTHFAFTGNLVSKQLVTVNAALVPVLPNISNVTVVNVTADSATVQWATDQASSSVVEYGESTTYGSTTNDAALTTSHSITLSGLKPSTTYHFRVLSTNGYGFSASTGDATFATPAFTVKTIGDNGNVTVMEVRGNYDAKNVDGTINALPRQEIAKEYFKTHGDVDFLVMLTTFDHAMPETGAEGFYLQVKNDVQGIGQSLFDNSNLFGSSGKLQGTIDLGNVTALAASPYGPKLDETLTVLNHEVGHRWGSYVRFKNPDGTLNTVLLGNGSAHWSYLLDTQGSIMYGNGWKDNGNGTFTSVSKQSGYSPLDLYLMGMIPKEQVPPMTLIENAAIDKNQLPQLGATITGTARTITIDDIIAAEGARVPDASTSPKSFNVGFVLLTRPGDTTGTAPTAIETLRSVWAGRFAELTQGIGGVNGVTPSLSVIIDSPSDGATVTGPDVTVTGTVINSTSAETGIIVNGIPATVSGSRFIVNHVPLQEGANTITINATDVNGQTSTATRSVTAAAGNYIRISSNIESGVAPLNVAIRLDGSFDIANPTIATSGPVPLTLTPGTSPTEFTAQLSVEGTYTITARAQGPDNHTYSDTVTITVLSRTQLENLLKNKWAKMKERIAAGDATGALTSIAGRAQTKYGEFLTALGPQLPLLNDYLKGIELVYQANGYAKCRLYREKTIMGVVHNIEYIVYFAQENGIWKVVQF